MDCYACEGNGEWPCPVCTAPTAMLAIEGPRASCPRCGGQGFVICWICGGTGYLEWRE